MTHSKCASRMDTPSVWAYFLSPLKIVIDVTKDIAYKVASLGSSGHFGQEVRQVWCCFGMDSGQKELVISEWLSPKMDIAVPSALQCGGPASVLSGQKWCKYSSQGLSILGLYHK